MRFTIGLAGVLGFGMSVTAALAQGPGATRGARLLPPQPLEPGDAQLVARGAADASVPPPTPVGRPGAKAAGGPVWINGTSPADGGVRHAAATSGGGSSVRPLTPRDDPAAMRAADKLRNPLSQPQPGGPERKNTATASTPFQGMAPNGQPVYAGPPAYRWYGWGSVTPGANPVAPSGHYPAASANWYSITGATPGAFPVPVSNPSRPAAGMDPPVYVSSPGGRAMMPTVVPQGTTVSHPTSRAPARQPDAPALPPAPVVPPAESVTHSPPAEPARPLTV
ncbi:MAG TPA: hypothetical protein VM597_04910, partial [Gemmataceae bacterium]|nr:hypothetical protein [Gemmataceae bacterium]